MSIYKDVYLTYQEEYDPEKIYENLHLIFEKMGGLQQWIQPHSSVLLKPNLVFPAKRERNALTDPAIIEAVIRLLKDFSCSITLGDSPAFDSAQRICRGNGIEEVCERHQVPIISLKKNTAFDEQSLWQVSSDLKQYDHLVNLPKLKGHQQLYFTGAVKNLFGCISGKKKFFHHMVIGDKDAKFGKMLLDLVHLIKPSLNIIDGIGVQAGRGPINGDPMALGVLGVSECPISLDIAICKLLGADFNKLDVYQAMLRYYEFQEDCYPETRWLGEVRFKEGFYFPSEKSPIRFSLTHSLKSVYKSVASKFKLA